jgi:hypothetical protein
MSLTTDPNDKRLGHGSEDEDDGKKPQHEVYLVLSEEERAKGYVRPVRDTYRHVGIRPKYPTRPLTPDEVKLFGDGPEGYVCVEEYPEEMRPLTQKFWTAQELESGCGATTTMGRALAETYARKPQFYGATYCTKCQRHPRVEEFIWVDTIYWTDTDERVGS